MQQKQNLWLPVISTLIIGGTVFGLMGYYLGQMNGSPISVIKQTDGIITTPTPTIEITTTPTKINPTPSKQSVSPTVTAQIRKLSYKLPDNWKIQTDNTGILSVGYDSTKYNASPREKWVDLEGIWTGTGTIMKRLGGNMSFYLTNYDGGSRHVDLLKILGVSTNSSDWKNTTYYSERDYLYSGWNCLVINGVNISQFPVAWAFCPLSSTQALVMAFDTYSWPDIERQMAAVKLVK